MPGALSFPTYSSGATGGIAFAGFAGATGGVLLTGFSIVAGVVSGTACGSIEPAACCGADAGRLRGTGGSLGVTAADFAAGAIGFGWATSGGAAFVIMREPMSEPDGAISKSSIG